ncbi:MAG TPA: hypothetical protein VFR81_15015 [Longimicrobium sp.]|nr:hypothetical protein [Longimicrobium sp.]
MRGRSPVHLLLLPLALLCACSADGSSAAAGRGASARSLSLERIAFLDDGSFPVLAEPVGIAFHSSGRLVIPDFSDRNLKIYDSTGARTGTLGRAGQGPGEFTGPMYAGFYRDSLVNVDFVGPVSFFSPDWRFARAVRFRGRRNQAVMDARVVDDSLLLLHNAPVPGMGMHLLNLVRSDGRVVSSFFDRSRFLGRDPAVIQRTAVKADGRGGIVFAGMAGGDSIFAFDYSGRLLASAPLDPVQPLPTTPALLAAAGGKPRRADGRWFNDQQRMLIRVVALDSATAALQVAPYDPRNGLDPLEGGTLLLVTLHGGALHHIGRADLPAGLMGRDAEGDAILIGYDGPDMNRYVLSRLIARPVRER